MSAAETANLTNLQKLKAEREALDRKIQEQTAAIRGEELAKVRAVIAEFEFTSNELFSTKGVRKSAGTKVPPKYRSPNGETWTGRGKAPKWIADVPADKRAQYEIKD